MSNRQRMMLALACAVLAAALLALFLYRSATAAERSQRALLKRYGAETVEVLVARKALASGTVLTDSLMEIKQWPVTLLPEGSLFARDRSEVLGKRTTSWIAQGEPLAQKRVLQTATRLDALKAGMSAVTLSTDAVHALGGEVSTGMRVTLMGTGQSGVVSALATNIEVLSSSATARDEDDDDSKAGGLFARSGTGDINWVTLAVPTPQAAQILSAAQTGKLWLVLQNGAAK